MKEKNWSYNGTEKIEYMDMNKHTPDYTKFNIVDANSNILVTLDLETGDVEFNSETEPKESFTVFWKGVSQMYHTSLADVNVLTKELLNLLADKNRFDKEKITKKVKLIQEITEFKGDS